MFQDNDGGLSGYQADSISAQAFLRSLFDEDEQLDSDVAVSRQQNDHRPTTTGWLVAIGAPGGRPGVPPVNPPRTAPQKPTIQQHYIIFFDF